MVKTSTLIAQITDCHLSADPQQEYRGINPHQNLESLMQKVKSMKPDLLLASGDLSEDGSRASYRFLKQYLGQQGIPVLALPGNHDNAEMLAEAFPGSPVDSIGISEHGPWQIIRLNSCIPGKPEGRLGVGMLKELEYQLVSDKRRPRLIAMHHQPVSVGSPWIDKYPLLDPESLLRLIDLYGDVKVVIWGHIHQAFDSGRNDTAMLGGPSSAINGLPGSRSFTMDPSGPAFRWLELAADGTIQTEIIK